MQNYSPKKIFIFIVVLCFLGAGLATVVTRKGVEKEANQITPPAQFFPEYWGQLLGGDQELDQETWNELSQPDKSDLLASDFKAITELSKSVVIAEKTGVDRDKWPEYFPINYPANFSKVSTLAGSAIKMPVVTKDTFAKSVVVWVGECKPDVDVLTEGCDGNYVVSYLYAQKTKGGWIPIREWDVPGGSITGSGDNGVLIPADWEMKAFPKCGNAENSSYKDLIVVVNAFEEICKEAEKEGISIKVVSGFRTAQEQETLYKEAIEHYGSEIQARQWVSFSDGVMCSSKNCAGTAFRIEEKKESLEFLNKPVGCMKQGVFIKQLEQCSEEDRKVVLANLYGFSSPLQNNPGYFEYVLPTTTSQEETAISACNPPANASIPDLVARIFRCRLSAAGIQGEEQKKVVAEAVVVSKCASNWSAGAMAFDGKFRTTPYPLTGETYSQAGVFMLSQDLAQRFVPGGYNNVQDPVANINGAASLWLSSGSWGPWPCATGAKSIVSQPGPVLPQFGGPSLPKEAFSY